MTISFRRNPLEYDEYGYIPDYEKTWICFTMTIKKAPDEYAVNDAFDFMEWYMNEKAEMPCCLLGCLECAGGIHRDILSFERDKSKKRHVQYLELLHTLKEAKAKFYKEFAASIPPFILAATKKTA